MPTSLPRFDAPYAPDDESLVGAFLEDAALTPDPEARIDALARDLIGAIRTHGGGLGGVEAMLREYSLSTKEGLALMILAEALLRVPDAATADRLIEDKLGQGDFAERPRRAQDLAVSASAWALGISARIVKPGETPENILAALTRRLGVPTVRHAARQAMRVMGNHFVLGETIDDAIERSTKGSGRRYRYSFDMLGEGARTAEDAAAYRDAYAGAIEAIGRHAGKHPLPDRPGISVKLSALHPRYEPLSRERVMAELVPVVLDLARRAKRFDLNFTVDAEEADRLELSLDVIGAVLADDSLAGWDGFGLAVQAYQKRCIAVIDHVAELAERLDRRLMVRLVKGAYWDTEIKRGQERGLADYPVFTRKAATDLAFLAAADRLLAHRPRLFPQFATHNALSVASIVARAGGVEGYEFQRLHGMGRELYARLMEIEPQTACRIYAPVGTHRDLLAYLVRRLLENGASSSFVWQAADPKVPFETLLQRPATHFGEGKPARHPKLPLPRDLYAPWRINSAGIEFGDRAALKRFLAEIAAAHPPLRDARGRGTTRSVVEGAVEPRDDETEPPASPKVHQAAAPSTAFGGPPPPLHGGGWAAASLIDGLPTTGISREMTTPIDGSTIISTATDATLETACTAIAAAHRGFVAWAATPAWRRVEILDRVADAFEASRGRLIHLLQVEGGKTIEDALAELREAIDFCRYYAAEGRRLFAAPASLPGPTGEDNRHGFRPRGVFVAISPWNFPLAIFVGQLAAVLMAGNTVVAKPAEQTPLIAYEAVRLMHAAGLPPTALQLVLGDGAIGTALVEHPDVDGVVFTGSTKVARGINRALAAKDGPIVPLIAETGGINAMIVDATALPEQVADDVVTSAFRSAGQRCSALRLLLVQADVADKIIAIVAGAARELRLGDPRDPAVQIGPVIDAEAKAKLDAYAAEIGKTARALFAGEAPTTGHFVAPQIYEIAGPQVLREEIFGPILHVARYEEGDLDRVLDTLASNGYGLTLGIHSRIDTNVARIIARLPTGNVYVNRNMIGAVVGVQPFGGCGLSGTGPKAGGPHYLPRFATEQTVTINTAAAGGNAALIAMDDGE